VKLLFIVLFSMPFMALASTKDRLDKLMHHDMLGVQRAYFETIAGVAKRVNKNKRNYDINGCQIWITEDKDLNVTSIELLNISNKCTFNSSNIFLNGPGHVLTFGHINDYSFQAKSVESCFVSCGNAADPTYGRYFSAPRYMNFIEFYAEVTWSQRSLPAITKLNQELYRKFPNVDLSGYYLGKLIPQKIYDDAWINAFKNTRIERFRFGYNLNKD